MGKNLSDILLKPIITEKSSALTQHNKYTFLVSRDATKNTIRNAFHKVFPDRKILSIQTSKVLGHKKRTKSGYAPPKDGKKAIITIDGARIDYFPEVS